MCEGRMILGIWVEIFCRTQIWKFCRNFLSWPGSFKGFSSGCARSRRLWSEVLVGKGNSWSHVFRFRDLMGQMKKSRFLKTISAIWFCVKQVGSRVLFYLV